MIQNIFERIEQKYILNENEYLIIKKYLNEYFVRDKYFESNIYNIYFDNDNYDLIINSLEKPIYKEKVRLRSYNTFKNTDILFLEIKTKYKNKVYKRRVELTKDEFDKYINNDILPNRSQIMKEIDYRLKYYKLKPKILVAYDRKSYLSKESNDFRITFDSNLRYRFDNLYLDDCNNKKFFNEDKYIMEVKSLNALPLWFVKILNENKIYPTSFSKVGSIYMEEKRNLC